MNEVHTAYNTYIFSSLLEWNFMHQAVYTDSGVYYCIVIFFSGFAWNLFVGND